MKKSKKNIKKKSKKNTQTHNVYGIGCREVELIAGIDLSTDNGGTISSRLYSDKEGQYYLSLDSSVGRITVPESSELYRDYFESPLGEKMNKLISLHKKEGRTPILTITKSAMMR